MKKILLITLIISYNCFGQTAYIPTQANLENRKWFENARLGMFIHWGIYSSMAAGEWVMNERKITAQNYKRQLYGYYPMDFDPALWVSTAKNAGMQYITFTSRHHDGFSNWDTKASDWKITNTPYKKDVLKLLADECHKQNIKIFVYYSLLDWYRADYQHETGRTGKASGRFTKSDWNSYIKFMKAQLTEILTSYGEVSGIWFDGHWDQLDNDHDKTLKSKVNWHYDEIYQLIHTLQPQALIGNNHHLTPLPGEDFQMFEKDIPGKNDSGLSGQAVSDLPLETCETINNSWGYNNADSKYKSSKELIQYLIRAAGNGANFLLNVGPMPNGAFQPEFTERLDAIGKWMTINEKTIRGTQRGFINSNDNFAITIKNKTIYLHLLKPQKDLAIAIPYEISLANIFDSNQAAIPFKKVGLNNYYVFDFSNVIFNDVDTIVELQVK